MRMIHPGPSRRVSPAMRRWHRRLGLALGALLLISIEAVAQTGPTLGGNGKPIEITADRLIVNQQSQVATFSGHVDAVQGDMSLRADEIKVFYADQAKGDEQGRSGQHKGEPNSEQSKSEQSRSDQAKPDKAKAEKTKSDGQKGQAGGGAGPSANQSIKRIEAVGNVVIAAPDQTATGDRGVYDVAGGSITLDGNVVLTRADNVVRGGHLVYELASGLVTSTPPAVAEGQQQRVRALFTPQQSPAKGQ
jgi:lipopolysaccharide export system protein LptA